MFRDQSFLPSTLNFQCADLNRVQVCEMGCLRHCLYLLLTGVGFMTAPGDTTGGLLDLYLSVKSLFCSLF